MTRRELEEAVMNLEYLLSHHFDASKTAEYNKQLQAFRRELRALDQQQYSLAATAFKNNHYAPQDRREMTALPYAYVTSPGRIMREGDRTMNAIESLEQQVVTLRAVAEELQRIAANADIDTTAVSITAQTVQLAAKYLELMIRFTHHREDAAKARAASAAG